MSIEINLNSGNGDLINDEYILFKLNKNGNDMQRCLDIVSSYIKDNNLMLVGGMSIDFSLKSKGESLYSDFQIPDYDIIDYDNILHANNIATLLCDQGYKNISIVPAVHKTTMRVQIMGYTVFDSTFVPRYIYDKIPYREWSGYKFIDPVYQKIDQFTSLSLLWNITGPSFNITNRLAKDIKRKDMLNQFYVLDDNIIHSENDIRELMQQIHLKYKEQTIYNKIISKGENGTEYYSIDCDFIYHGKIAYCILLHEFKRKYKNSKFDSKKILDCPLEIKNEDMYFTIYGKNIEFIFADFLEKNNLDKIQNDTGLLEILCKKFNNVKKTSHISTSMPSKITYNSDEYSAELYDLTGNMLAINTTHIQSKKFILSNYNYILAYFLCSYFMSDSSLDKDIYKKYYLSLLYMAEFSQNIEDNINSLKDNTEGEDVFYYSMNNLGTKYWIDENYYYYVNNYNEFINTGKTLNSVPPKNYISSPDCEIKKTFSKENREKSEYYIDKVKEVSDTNFINELNKLLN